MGVRPGRQSRPDAITKRVRGGLNNGLGEFS
jgi:hypothetical protein